MKDCQSLEVEPRLVQPVLCHWHSTGCTRQVSWFQFLMTVSFLHFCCCAQSRVHDDIILIKMASSCAVVRSKSQCSVKLSPLCNDSMHTSKRNSMKIVRSAPFSNGSTNYASFSILQLFWSLGVDIGLGLMPFSLSGKRMLVYPSLIGL